MNEHYLVPHQLEGEQTDLDFRVSARNVADAEDWFVDAKDRLWQIALWPDCGKDIGLEFRLTDNHGHRVTRRARKDDHIVIVSSEAGAESHDWVIIGAVEYDDYPDDNRESFALHLLPAGQPIAGKVNAGSANDAASGTIVVERNHEFLIASFHGRNKDAGNTREWLNLSRRQWESLLKGIIA